jgi:FkbH-like protein
MSVDHLTQTKTTNKGKTSSIKCVVWDLDNTVWDGVLLEDEQVTLRQDVVEVIKTLDSRGILHSIASKNDYDTAMDKLTEFGLSDYFLYPQISWQAKGASIAAIAKSINIGLDTLAFVDDQPFEREEVAFSVPEVLSIDAADIHTMLDMPELNPRFITEDSSLRRQMYRNDIKRNSAEQEFSGAGEEFLATLDMTFSISIAQESDLRRAEELTVRTHQLNTTGHTYSYDELNEIRQSDRYKLYISGLDDKYGTYGKIGLTLIECTPTVWTIKLLLMSCRVMSRGVGTVMVNHIMRQAKEAGARLQAEFVETNRNRMMYVTYKFGGFKEIARDGDKVLFENDLTHIQPFPEYVKILIKE